MPTNDYRRNSIKQLVVWVTNQSIDSGKLVGLKTSRKNVDDILYLEFPMKPDFHHTVYLLLTEGEMWLRSGNM